MTDNRRAVAPVTTPIEVTSAQGVTDLLQAIVSYIFILSTIFSGFVALIGKGNTVALVTYIQSNLGTAVTAAFGLGGICLMIWRLYKTYKRGAQLATAASQPDSIVSNRVLRLKQDPEGRPLHR